MSVSKQKIITYWLYSGLITILLMIVIGGITRLTGSGLSIVDWSLFGGLPTDENIQDAYKLWLESPQGKDLGMNLQEYKFIFFWEYIHRMLGRFLGVLFIIPFLFFLIKNWIPRYQIPKYIVLLMLGGLQALIGWWMVESGLKDNPEVSHFRLAIHFISALALASYVWWIILTKNIEKEPNKPINRASKWMLIIILIQLIYGAFAAGLKAGNYIDLNNKGLISMLNTIFGYFNPSTHQDLNIINNEYNIMIIHRFIGFGILIFSIFIYFITRRTHYIKVGKIILIGTIIQVCLGVTYLILNNPKFIELFQKIHIYLGIIHQFTACILLLSIVYLIYKSQSNEKIQ